MSRVGVEKDTMFGANARALLIGWIGPTSLLAWHDADEDRARRDGPLRSSGFDHARIYPRTGKLSRAQAFKKPTRFNDCWMFYPRGDDVIANIAHAK